MLEEVKDDMVLIHSTCREAADFTSFLNNPVVQTSQKKQIIREIFKDKITNITLLFLELIIKNRRESFINDITRNFIDLYKKYKGIKTALLTTAVPIDDYLRNEIIEIIRKMYKTKIELNEHIDDELIGGFILRVDDQQFNAGIASKLNNVRRELIMRIKG